MSSFDSSSLDKKDSFLKNEFVILIISILSCFMSRLYNIIYNHFCNTEETVNMEWMELISVSAKAFVDS